MVMVCPICKSNKNSNFRCEYKLEIHEDKKMHERNSIIIIPSFAERYLSTQLFSEF